MNNNSILIIDDEVQIRKLLEFILTSENYKVLEAETGKTGLILAANHPPDLIILDLGLPDEDGLIILEKLREWYYSPIIILTVRDSEEDIVKALDSGANDYLVKPFRPGELLARIRRLLKFPPTNINSSTYEFDTIKIDFNNRVVTKKNERIKLTVTEFSLLSLLVRNEDRVLLHSYILKEIWGRSYMDQTQYLRVFIAALRKKIEDNPNRPKYIKTESGIGYRFITGKNPA